ncbi:MAG: hypothetical protein HY644_04600 [Acidobacteria bacterium]|nr:hypothetical protein [Acidobacteriota bacterium]
MILFSLSSCAGAPVQLTPGSRLDPLLRNVYQKYETVWKKHPGEDLEKIDPSIANLKRRIELDVSGSEPAVGVVVTVDDQGKGLQSAGFPAQLRNANLVVFKIPVRRLVQLAGTAGVVYVEASTISEPETSSPIRQTDPRASTLISD